MAPLAKSVTIGLAIMLMAAVSYRVVPASVTQLCVPGGVGNAVSVYISFLTFLEVNKCYCGKGSKFPKRPMRVCYWDGVENDRPFKSTYGTQNIAVGKEALLVVIANGQLPARTVPVDGEALWEDPTWDNWPHAPKSHFWGQNRSYCDMDPAEPGESLFNNCRCYDGFEGKFCESPIEPFCLNQCSGHGECHHGYCKCHTGFFGVDCSRRVSSKPTQVERPRPLIYVYEMPGHFNFHMFQQRIKQEKCVLRYYSKSGRPETMWSDNLYGAEVALLESLLRSPHRTTNPDMADFFFVPVFGSCLMSRFLGPTPRHAMSSYGIFNTGYFAAMLYRRAQRYVMSRLPYWNRTKGRDHMFVMNHDEGACFAPKEIWPSIMLTHWGRITGRYPNNTHTFIVHQWTRLHHDTLENLYGGHPCYDPAKDVVLPSWRRPDHFVNSPLLDRTQRDFATEEESLFFFSGDLRFDQLNYSLGIRQQVATLVAGNAHTVAKQLKAVWKLPVEDAVLHGCIPAIIQDDIHVPYESELNISEFAVRIPRAEIGTMFQRLRAIPQDEVIRMKAAVARVWPRFIFADTFRVDDSGIRELPLLHDSHSTYDAMSLLLQKILHRCFRYTHSQNLTPGSIPR
eukprot:gene2550-3302_t